MKPGNFQADSIILSRTNYSEADLIVTFLTKEYGKLSGLAKHGRKSIKRFGNILNSLALINMDFTVQKGRDLARLNKGDLIRSFESVAGDINRLGLAGYTLELADNFLAAQDPAPMVFDLILWALDRFDRGERIEEAALVYMLRLLSFAGFGPNIDSCPMCGKGADDAGNLNLKPEHGGIICRQCAPSGFPASAGTLKLIKLIQTIDPGKLDRVRVSAGALREAGPFARAYVTYTLGKELKSARFLNQLDRRN